MRKVLAAIALVLGMAFTPAFAQAAPEAPDAPPEIARFINDPLMASAQLSPNGQRVAAIRFVDGGHALVVVDWRTRAARAVQTARYDRGLSIGWIAWKGDDRLVFSLYQNTDARGNPISELEARRMAERRGERFGFSRLFALNADGTGLVQLLERDVQRLLFGSTTFLVSLLPEVDNQILIAGPTDQGMALWRVDVATGRGFVMDQAGFRTGDWIVDRTGMPVLRYDLLSASGSRRYWRRAPGRQDWERFIDVRSSDARKLADFEPLAAGPQPGQIYVSARVGEEDKAAIRLLDTATGQYGPVVFDDPVVDTGEDFFAHPATGQPIFGCATAARQRCRALDPAYTVDLEALRAAVGPDQAIRILSSSADGQVWLFRSDSPDNPGTLLVYDRATRTVTPVAPVQRVLPGTPSTPAQVFTYNGSDGAELWGYLFLPETGGDQKALVVLPHGGPETRDEWAYDPLVQLLASRGYAVFQPNFRGGSGFGRAFTQAGHGQWGRRMQDDITDGVRALIAAGHIDPDRICIVGGSYGGYAALAGAAFTPDLYACAVSINGVSDPLGMLREEQRDDDYGRIAFEIWTARIGNISRDRERIEAISPVRSAATIRAPILLVAGEADLTVPASQSEAMEEALRSAGKPVELMRFPLAGHNFYLWSRGYQLRLYTAIDRFLAAHLGPPPTTTP
jgi:dipeptidyl aminopeptidase/acylaminoacyl peptidase